MIFSQLLQQFLVKNKKTHHNFNNKSSNNKTSNNKNKNNNRSINKVCFSRKKMLQIQTLTKPPRVINLKFNFSNNNNNNSNHNIKTPKIHLLSIKK